MGGAHKLHAAFGDRARRLRLKLGADFVDYDYLGHVVLDRLDHHGMLAGRRWYLHPARAPNARMRDVTVPGDLIRGIDDHYALVKFVGQNARHFAKHGRLANAGAAQKQHALAGLDYVADDGDGPIHGTADAAGQAYHTAFAVPDGRDSVQGALDARAVVFAKVPNAADDEINIIVGYDQPIEASFTPAEPNTRLPQGP
jgi:hypothetical protein